MRVRGASQPPPPQSAPAEASSSGPRCSTSRRWRRPAGRRCSPPWTPRRWPSHWPPASRPGTRTASELARLFFVGAIRKVRNRAAPRMGSFWPNPGRQVQARFPRCPPFAQVGGGMAGFAAPQLQLASRGASRGGVRLRRRAADGRCGGCGCGVRRVAGRAGGHGDGHRLLDSWRRPRRGSRPWAAALQGGSSECMVSQCSGASSYVCEGPLVANVVQRRISIAHVKVWSIWAEAVELGKYFVKFPPNLADSGQHFADNVGRCQATSGQTRAQNTASVEQPDARATAVVDSFANGGCHQEDRHGWRRAACVYLCAMPHPYD